jgi:hypothetical protein
VKKKEKKAVVVVVEQRKRQVEEFPFQYLTCIEHCESESFC